eukprot:Sspe_Gene.101869::Locus_76535_Transcript_1_2_Confidence_0.667_Length_2267::g.101869::m.101869
MSASVNQAPAAPAAPALETDSATLHLKLHAGQSIPTPWGTFEVVGLLGEGNFSKIWRAVLRNNSNTTTVALKVYMASPTYALVGTDYEVTFLNELQKRHGMSEYLINFYGHFLLPGTPAPHVVLVCELLGSSVYEVTLKGEAPLRHEPSHVRRSAAIRVLHQMLHALVQLEEVGLIHGDIKPENILTKATDTPLEWNSLSVKLSDFNHCRSLAPTPLPKESPWHLGTVWYNAPELLMGYSDALTPAIDVWALACTVAEMVCCGVPLFSGGKQIDAENRTPAAYAMLHQIQELLGAEVPQDLAFSSSLQSTFFSTKFTSSPSHMMRRQSSIRSDTFPTMGSPSRLTCKDVLLGDLGSPVAEFRNNSFTGSLPSTPASSVGPLSCVSTLSLKSVDEYANDIGVKPKCFEYGSKAFHYLNSTDITGDLEGEMFLDLLYGMLTIDPRYRLTAAQALKHPLFTGPDMWKGKGEFAKQFEADNLLNFDLYTARREAIRASQEGKAVECPLPRVVESHCLSRRLTIIEEECNAWALLYATAIKELSLHDKTLGNESFISTLTVQTQEPPSPCEYLRQADLETPCWGQRTPVRHNSFLRHAWRGSRNLTCSTDSTPGLTPEHTPRHASTSSACQHASAEYLRRLSTFTL